MTFALAVPPGAAFGVSVEPGATDVSTGIADDSAGDFGDQGSTGPGDGGNTGPGAGSGNPAGGPGAGSGNPADGPGADSDNTADNPADNTDSDNPAGSADGADNHDGFDDPNTLDDPNALDDPDATDGQNTPDDPDLLSALSEIEALTVDPAPADDIDGYIVVVKPEEVTEEMIEAAPEEPVADNLFAVESPEDALAFAEPDQIEAIEPNYVMKVLDFPQDPPDDPNYRLPVTQSYNQWNLNGEYGVNAQGAWAFGASGAGVRVAVLDTGVNHLHQDMGPINEGYNFTGDGGTMIGKVINNNYESVRDVFGHGTMVSSILAAKTDNGLNIAGLAYGAEIVPFKILNDYGEGSTLHLIAALNYIAKNNNVMNIGVINMSLGGPMSKPSAELQNVINELLDQGVILVAAVGNGYDSDGNASNGAEDVNILMYPAACDGVIGVASITQTGVRSSFSQKNKSVDVAAPGQSITGLSNTNNTGVKSGSGTSYSSPLVAAVAAMAKELDPWIDSDLFLAAIESSSLPPNIPSHTPKSPEYGFGLLDAAALLAECDNLIYTVTYSYDGEPDEGLTQTYTVGSDNPLVELDGIPAQPKPGYKFQGYTRNGVPFAPEPGQGHIAIENGDIIELVYVRDDSQVVNFTIIYEYGGQIEEPFAEAKSVWAGDPTVTADKVAEKPKPGYLFSGTVPPLPAAVSEGETVKAVYKIDKTQAINYTVRYFAEGAAEPYFTEEKSVWQGEPFAPAPDPAPYAKPGYEFGGYRIGGEPVPEGDFPIIIKDGDMVDLYYLISDLVYENGGWRLYDRGAPVFGWVEAAGGSYQYFDEEKGRLHGLALVPGLGEDRDLRWCYFDLATGDVVTGPVTIGGYGYYFDGVNGMLRNVEAMMPDGKYYWLDANGRSVTGWKTLPGGGKAYYAADGRAAGPKKISGKFYYFDRATGRMFDKAGLIPDDIDGNGVADQYFYCYSTKGYLRNGKFTAKLNTAADKGKPWYSTSSKTYFADKKTAALIYGQVKSGQYYYWSEGPMGYLKNVERVAGGKQWFYKSNGRRTSGWVTFAVTTGTYAEGGHQAGDKAYFHKKEGLLTGAKKISSYWYWLDPARNGALHTQIGEVVDDRDPENIQRYYCYSKKGYLTVRGEGKVENGGVVKLYYYGKDGARVSGPVKIGSYIYFYDRESFERIVPGQTPGMTGAGWIEDCGKSYYITAPHGRLKTGKFTDPETGAQVYLSKSTGEAVAGPVKISGKYYYYGGKDGLDKATGWKYDAKTGKWYYTANSAGQLKTGLFTDQATGQKYYFSTKDASRQAGAQKTGGKWYWFDPERNGAMHREIGWVEDARGNKKGYYCYSASGYLRTGKQDNSKVIGDGKVYYFNKKDAKIFTGQVKISGAYYCFEGYGGMVRDNEVAIKGNEIAARGLLAGVAQASGYKVYYFKANGKRASGWVTFTEATGANTLGRRAAGEKAYYTSKGIVLGPKAISKKYYFFDRQTGALVRASGATADGNAPVWIQDGKNRYCTTRLDGRLKKGSQTVAGAAYYFSAKGVMAVNIEKKISGKWYFFDADGVRMKSSWLEFPDGRQVYYGSNGARYSGSKKVALLDGNGAPMMDASGKAAEYVYYFNTKTGKKATGWVTASKKTYYHDPGFPEKATADVVGGGTRILAVPGARLYGVNIIGGKEVYLDPKTGVLLTGSVKIKVEFPEGSGTLKSYRFYYDGKKGKVFGKEKKSGGYWYYFRAADEESGVVYDSDGKTPWRGTSGRGAAPKKGPAGSAVTGWWRLKGAEGLKYYSEKSGQEGRRLHGRQQLALHYWSNPAAYGGKSSLYFMLDPSNGKLRNGDGRGDSGILDGYAWETDGNGVVTKWEYIYNIPNNDNRDKGDVMRGVDVSYWQGDISASQWKQVRASGVQFAIIRAGYCNLTAGSDKFEIDSKFAANVRNARAAGLYVGAYIYVYSRNITEQGQMIDQFAREMAQVGISPASLDLPVFLDVEDSVYYLPSTNQLGGYNYRTDMLRTGMKQLESKGYKAGFYTYLSFANNYFDAKKLSNEGYTFWLASFYANNSELNPSTAAWNCSYPGIWQYRSTGAVPGISGRVDMNYLYSGRVRWA